LIPISLIKRLPRASLYTAAVAALDRTARRTAPDSESARTALSALRQHGYVNLGPILELGDVPERIGAAFDQGQAQHEGSTRFYLKHPLTFAPRIAGWLQHGVVNQIIKSYLGDGAIYDRCLVWRIPASASERKTSAVWHHDWCGHRLKLFVLMHDVTEEGRPTQYLRGSHRGAWRWMDYELSRFEDSTVEGKGQQIVKLVGQRGDAILVDTNGLHRATGEGGRQARDIVCLEYSDRRKSDWLARHGFEIGVKQDEIPAELDISATLIAKDRLRDSTGALIYGSVPQLEREPFISPSAASA